MTIGGTQESPKFFLGTRASFGPSRRLHQRQPGDQRDVLGHEAAAKGVGERAVGDEVDRVDVLWASAGRSALGVRSWSP